MQTIKHATNLAKCSTSHNLCIYIIECQVFKLIEINFHKREKSSTKKRNMEDVIKPKLL